MKKWITGTICMLCMMLLVPFNAEAASYKKLYKEFLSNSKVEAGNTSIEPKWYYVLNIDKKGEKELIVSDSTNKDITCYVYTIKKNKVTYLGQSSLIYSVSDTNQPTFFYSSKYKGLITDGRFSIGVHLCTTMYKIQNKKLTEKYYAYTGYHTANQSKLTQTYAIGTTRKEVSKKEYDSYYNKYFKSKKTCKMKKNTKSNLKKSFK